jgi:hypothetical protein
MHLTENDYLRLNYRGNVEPAKRVPKNLPRSDRGRNPLPSEVPLPPPDAPVAHSKKSPSFSTLKNIVMDTESLTAEQKLDLIDKISDLYA